MSVTTRGKLFDEMEPDLTDSEIKAALDTNSIVLSLRGKPMPDPEGAIRFLAVKFAISDGSFSTVLFDRLSASALKALFDATDQINWDGKSLKPSSTTH